MLALNVVNRSYLELLQPLGYDQAAPPGFLWIEKTAIQVLSDSEYALRLFPLIAGIISMIAFYSLSKLTVTAIAVPVALFLFACSRYTLYYATEVKQYSSDVMLAILLALVLIPLRGQLLANRRKILLGMMGAIAVWFSHPVIFVLAGIEIANWITIPANQRRAILINRSPAYGLWIISFATVYFTITANVMQNRSLQSAWGGEYPGTVFDLLWLLESFGRFFYRPLGYIGPFDGVAIVAFLAGCFAFFKLGRRIDLLIIMAPAFTTLMATYLHKYPFRGRLILFLTPFFILVIAEGVAYLCAQFPRRKATGVLGGVLAGLLLIPPANRATSFVFQPEMKEEIRPVLAYVKTHQQPTDRIYADAFNHVQYYADKFGYTKADYVSGYGEIFNYRNPVTPQALQNYLKANNLQSGQRVWFVFAGVSKKGRDEVKARLDSIGQLLDYFEQPGAYTYLYQLK